MNIVIVSNVTRGLYSFRRELMEILARDHAVTVLASDTGRVPEMEAMGCRFVNVGMDRHGTNPLTELKLIVLYRKLLKELKPDVVLTYTIKPNIYAGMACASMGIPYIANITGLGMAVETENRTRGIMLKLYRYGLRKARIVFFQNRDNLDFMVQRGIVSGDYDLIPGSGVNLERYHTLAYPDGETVNFFYIGRLMKQKGIEQYLEAARQIGKTHPETRFHICGIADKEYEDVVKDLHERGIVVYHGHVNDMVSMHAISACTLHPTFYPEGMSNVLLESCACARPIITTDRPGCREIVEDGVNGFVVRQQDSADLIEKIEKFLSLPLEARKQMGLAGRAKVEREFDRRIVIDKYLEQIMRAEKQ